jgi:hypothetical protein
MLGTGFLKMIISPGKGLTLLFHHLEEPFLFSTVISGNTKTYIQGVQDFLGSKFYNGEASYLNELWAKCDV